MRKISDSTIRRLSVYLRFLEQAKAPTISSGELARLGGTTSAQVRKDLSFFGSFGKRGLGYAVPELTRRIRDIVIVATPAEAAQQVVDRLVRSGVKAILNFAPVPLNVPPDVEVKTVNMALELETLSYSLANR